MSVVYDMILSAIHNLSAIYNKPPLVVYDMILSAIHNIELMLSFSLSVVYDMILSAMSKNSLQNYEKYFNSPNNLR